MKKVFTTKLIFAALAAVTLFGATETWAQKPTLHRRTTHRRVTPRKPVEPLYSVATGTILRARMNQTISSRTARVGDTFTVTVTEPVYSTNGIVVVPVGATLTGRVNSVRAADKGGKPGQIDASFNRLRLPNGRSRYINGSLTDLEGGKTTSDNEGTVTGRGMKYNRKVVFIGGGTVGGAILGGAIGGGKGALIGGLLGAAGGFAGDRLTKGPDAEVKSGTQFGVYLNQGISLPRFGETQPVRP
ncbi:MAG: hypothetical protein ACJ73D_06450 [Pyrinomonadaceae bacterium]